MDHDHAPDRTVAGGAEGARDIFVLGGSAGALMVARSIVAALPSNLPASIFVVLHANEAFRGDLAARVGERTSLASGYARDGEPILRGRIYVARPGRNLVVRRGAVGVDKGPPESFHRPSINGLFRSAAQAYGRRVAGVILSGTMTDGVAGLWEVKRRGGLAIVQDPADARYPELPANALTDVEVDHRVSMREIAPILLGIATAIPEAPLPSGSRRANLVIVEDERIVAADLADQLAGMGYTVCANVASADQAMEAIDRLHPDLVLMDIRLGGSLDGTQAANAIWERRQSPVVYLTAYADEDTLAAVKRTEAYGYVMKPYEPREVHAAIQLALERRERETVR